MGTETIVIKIIESENFSQINIIYADGIEDNYTSVKNGEKWTNYEGAFIQEPNKEPTIHDGAETSSKNETEKKIQELRDKIIEIFG